MADSKLSSEQVLARSFDPTTDKLKVDAEVTATVGQMEVAIDAQGGDSIAIKNSVSGNELDVEADGSINVNVTIDRSDSITTYGADEAKRLDDTTTPNITYIGFAALGSSPASAVWKIYRINETTGFATEYADGNANYDNIWNNRASLSYT